VSSRPRDSPVGVARVPKLCRATSSRRRRPSVPLVAAGAIRDGERPLRVSEGPPPALDGGRVGVLSCLSCAAQTQRRELVARKAIRLSDISGQRIEEGGGARVRIVFDDPRKGAIEIDVLAHEIRDLAAKGRKARRRTKLRDQAP
jgi:hypothetical protein